MVLQLKLPSIEMNNIHEIPQYFSWLVLKDLGAFSHMDPTFV
jgi:hypothetical protein